MGSGRCRGSDCAENDPRNGVSHGEQRGESCRYHDVRDGEAVSERRRVDTRCSAGAASAASALTTGAWIISAPQYNSSRRNSSTVEKASENTGSSDMKVAQDTQWRPARTSARIRELLRTGLVTRTS
jgi:hypothetical protein